MASKPKADMEVLDMVKEPTEVVKPKAKKKATKATRNEEPPVEPEPDPAPPVEPEPDPEPPVELLADPIYMDIPFTVMDRVIAGVGSGKTIKEAIEFDSRLSSAYADHPFIVVRESRNAYYYALRDDLPLMASTKPQSIGMSPVSYAIPK